MDDERTPSNGVDQDGQIVEPEPEASPPRMATTRTMFEPGDEQDRAAQRAVRRRALMLGLAGGAVASLLIAVCAILAYVVSTSS